MKSQTLAPWLGPTAVAAMLLTASVFFVNRAADVQPIVKLEAKIPATVAESLNELGEESGTGMDPLAVNEVLTELVEKISPEQVLNLLDSEDPNNQAQAQQLVLALALSEDFQKKAMALDLLPLLPGLSREQKNQFSQRFCSHSIEPLRFEAEYLRARWLRSQSTHYSLKKMRIPCLEGQGHSS